MTRAAPAMLVAAALLAGCGGDDEPTRSASAVPVQDGPQHVHGLGVNPADGALYIATHTGLWRSPKSASRATRVGDLQHDLMGFTVAGADAFLSSGHPDAQEDLPPHLGLQRSTDRGRSWTTVSLLGEADLHVVRAAGRRIYGIDSTTGRFLTSDDGGRTWEQRPPPSPMIDLAIDPADPERVVGTTERGLFASADTGRRWRRLHDDAVGLLAWPARESLYLVQGDGTVWRSRDGGVEFARAGSIAAQPEAFAAASADELYAAVHGGEIRMSSDGGASWRLRSKP